MIPLRDNQPTSTFPIVTITIIVVNVLIYFAQQIPALGLESAWSMVPYEITHNVDLVGVLHVNNLGNAHFYTIPPGATVDLGPNDIYFGPTLHPLWLTIFTAMFMHASILHIGGNMLYFWVFGNNIEDALGRFRFTIFYFVCGLCAAIGQIIADPNSYIPTLGASGAIAGVLGAYFLLYPNARVLSIIPIFGFGVIREISAFWVLGLWIALQVFEGFSGSGNLGSGGVAYFAHIGGFISGCLLILFMGGRTLVTRQAMRANYRTPYDGGYRQ